MRLFSECPGDRESGERCECKHCNEHTLGIETLPWIWAWNASVVSIGSMVCMCVRLFPQLSGLETEEVVKGVSANTAVHTRGYRSLKSYLGDGCGGGVQTTSLCCLCSIHKSITLLEAVIAMQEVASPPCESSASSSCDQCGRQNANLLAVFINRVTQPEREW